MQPQTQMSPVDSRIEIEEQGTRYGVLPLHPDDPKRLAEYQRLRGAIFVRRLGWQIPIDEEGKEVDRYDGYAAKSFVRSHGVFGLHHHREQLLGGVRISTLRIWSESMVENEFYTNGMLPDHALQLLESEYRSRELLELTRLCVDHVPLPPFRREVARDLIYAAIYAMAQATGRKLALVLVDSLCFQVVRRSHFIFRDIYKHRLDQRAGYALVVIDLWDTIHALHARGDHARVTRMLSLCA
jgi:N-acyl-L-homoserine lactone synthetase